MNIGKIKIVAPRNLDDFLLDKKRYELPKDVLSCNKRVLNNLHYYETNYFIVLLLISIFISYITPAKWFIGLFSILLSVGSFIYGTSKQPQIKSIYEDYPFLFMFLNLISAYLVVYALDSVSVFILSITTPLLIIFLHASLRIKGKESVSNSTAMHCFLSWSKLLPKDA